MFTFLLESCLSFVSSFLSLCLALECLLCCCHMWRFVLCFGVAVLGTSIDGEMRVECVEFAFCA